MGRMIGWRTGMFALFAAVTLAGPAPADDAERLIGSARADCAAIENGTLAVGEDAVARIDLTGDGTPDTLLDYAKLHCSSAQSFGCGTGGCQLEVMVDGTPGDFLARDWEVYPWDDLVVLLLRVHPSECGMVDGLPPCVRAVSWSEAGWRTVGGMPQ
jgi:hypothetical protein